MNIKKHAFTLAELLIAMVILGVIAALTIPVLLSNVFSRSYAAAGKNMISTIEQLAADELVDKRTRLLSSTDFADASRLLTSEHFEVNSNSSCNVGEANCMSPADGFFKLDNHESIDNPFPAGATALVLKNGTVLTYTVQGGKERYARFIFDVNGADKPNTVGRDIFAFDVDIYGHYAPQNAATEQGCRGGDVMQCVDALMNNAWNPL